MKGTERLIAPFARGGREVGVFFLEGIFFLVGRWRDLKELEIGVYIYICM